MNKITLGFFRTKSKTTIIKLLMLFVFLLMYTQLSWGQILTEDFNYTNASTLVSNGWTAHGNVGINTILVASPTISYAGYTLSGIANEVALTSAGGEDVNKTFASQTTGTIYTSFLVNVTSATTTGDYFFNVGATTIGTTYKGRIFVKRDLSNNVSFGISQSTTTVNYSSAVYALNTTYLIVLKYDIVSGPTNDLASIFINPPLNSVVPSTGWITNTDASGTDLANLGTIA
jgi:hypothetical protein